jgi:hypothetical protein
MFISYRRMNDNEPNIGAVLSKRGTKANNRNRSEWSQELIHAPMPFLLEYKLPHLIAEYQDKAPPTESIVQNRDAPEVASSLLW